MTVDEDSKTERSYPVDACVVATIYNVEKAKKGFKSAAPVGDRTE